MMTVRLDRRHRSGSGIVMRIVTMSWLAWIFHLKYDCVEAVSMLLVIPAIDKIGCVEKRLSSTCSQVCEKRNDTVAVMFRDMIPCSELPWYYDRRKDPWFCREFNVSDFDPSVPFILASLESAYNFYYFGDELAMKRFSACQGYHRSCQWVFSFVADPLSGFDLSAGGRSVLAQLRNPKERLSIIYRKLGELRVVSHVDTAVNAVNASAGGNFSSTLRLQSADRSVTATDNFSAQKFVNQVRAAMNASIFYMASNVNAQASGRSKLVAELQQYIPVDSWGLDQLNVDRSFLSQYKSNVFYQGYEKLAIMAQYKFALAFENSFTTDYITEKFWGALAVGTVPVVLAHPSIYEYLPDPMAIINVRDFNTTEALARYLERLLADETLYQKHLEWKRREFPKKFVKFIHSAARMTDDKIVLDICDTYQNPQKWKKPNFDDHRKDHWGSGVFIPTALPTVAPSTALTAPPSAAPSVQALPTASRIQVVSKVVPPRTMPAKFESPHRIPLTSSLSVFYSLYMYCILAAAVCFTIAYKLVPHCCTRAVKPRQIHHVSNTGV
jgi:hypothetical protein